MPCTGDRYVVRDAVDRVHASWRAFRKWRISGRQAVALRKPEKADHAVDVQKHERFLLFFDHKKGVTNIRSAGINGGSVQTIVENSTELIKLEGYAAEI